MLVSTFDLFAVAILCAEAMSIKYSTSFSPSIPSLNKLLFSLSLCLISHDKQKIPLHLNWVSWTHKIFDAKNMINKVEYLFNNNSI